MSVHNHDVRRPNSGAPVVSDVDSPASEREALIAARDFAIAERDIALAELDRLHKTRSWRLTKPLRWLANVFRRGLSWEDRQRWRALLRHPWQRTTIAGAVPAIAPVVQPISRPIAAPVAEGRLDIVCFANIDWAARFQRPQQLMSQFARHGYRVFYVVASRQPPAGRPYQMHEVYPGVFEVALQARAAADFYRQAANRENVLAYVDALDALVADQRIKTAVSVVHLPFWTPLVEALRDRHGWRIQYDCMDDWVDFPNFGPALLRTEEALVASADLVTVTAAVLQRKWSARSARCLLVRNAVDFDFFARHGVPSTLLAGIAHPIIGFYGALAEWVDLPLIAAIAARRPDWNFVLVGDIFVNDLAGLDRLANVHLLGRKPYEEMPLYLYHFDVCLIPFRLYNVTHAVDPVKFYEFVSAGKPVVSVPLEEMQIYAEYVEFATGADEFIARIAAALAENDLTAVGKRVALARSNDWQARFEVTRDALVELHPKVSVIVVTYNNVELTRDCLDSILRNTTYPNYEVIIVDNASSDDTRNYLRYFSRGHDNVRIILNDDNRGFAAANNQGLAIASGDYFVLLNNDTVVPKGWVDPLLRHLADPSIGLVGPVTNSVGNEARVPVTYKDMAQMEVFADRRMARHRGRIFDIRMLAMFCVAMRREVVDRVGLLDEAFGIGMFEDDDYSRRIQDLGLRTVCAEDAFVHHHGQASFKKLVASGAYQALWDRNQAYFESKWGDWTPHVLRDAHTDH